MKQQINLDVVLKHLAAEISFGSKSDDVAISVIIPCFNAADHIHPCMMSLLKQTLPLHRFEVICIDDCSTDFTLGVLREYIDKLPNLRIITHKKNKKQGAARNTGLDAAKGRYVFFLDSDDYLRADALEVLLHCSDGSDLTICQHKTVRYDQPLEFKVSERRVVASLKLAGLDGSEGGWWPFGMLISRDMLERNSIRFREGVYFEDIDFNLRVFRAADTFKVTKEPLYFYLMRDGSTVFSLDEKKLADSALAMAVFFKIVDVDSDEQARIKARETAVVWLRLQAQRVKEGPKAPEAKRALLNFFIQCLRDQGVLAALPNELETEIRTLDTSTSAVLHAQSERQTSYKYKPWKAGLETEFANKVIFYCEVDYHIRSVAPIVRELRSIGVESIIVDASRSTSFSSNRPLADHELPLFADINIRRFNIAKEFSFSTEALAFVFSNDTTYTKQLIFENFGFGVPTFGLYEGINDDWNLDRRDPRLPYRSVDYLLLPGIYQTGFYQDRNCRVVGLPNVRSRMNEPYRQAQIRRAIINVNFTYGVLEHRRDEYVESAVRACIELGLDYIITQHPADKADLSRFKVSNSSVYDLLDEGSVLVSRFSTTILEALAMGRPVIYHNPIDEAVPKFKEPLGAYSRSHSVESLKSALNRELDFVEAGGDVRARAALFLHFHCNTAARDCPALLAARAIAEVLSLPSTRFAFKTGALYRQVAGVVPMTEAPKTGEKSTTRMDSETLLISASARMLLDAAALEQQIRDDSECASSLADAVRSLPKDNKALAHFLEVRAHVEKKAKSVA